MIFDIVQTKTSFSMEWEVLSNGLKIGRAEAPFMPNMFLAEVNVGNVVRKIIHNPNDTTYGSSLDDRLTFQIFDKNHHIGHMVGKTQKVKRLFGSYPYYEYVDDGTTYLVYEVGFGFKGLYLCFYRDDQLFCVVEKTLRTVNYRDHYRCYLQDDACLPIVSAFVIYYDTLTCGDFMEVAVHAGRTNVVNTYQKELKLKYDPAFIPKIKAREGITE